MSKLRNGSKRQDTHNTCSESYVRTSTMTELRTYQAMHEAEKRQSPNHHLRCLGTKMMFANDLQILEQEVPFFSAVSSLRSAGCCLVDCAASKWKVGGLVLLIYDVGLWVSFLRSTTRWWSFLKEMLTQQITRWISSSIVVLQDR